MATKSGAAKAYEENSHLNPWGPSCAKGVPILAEELQRDSAKQKAGAGA